MTRQQHVTQAERDIKKTCIILGSSVGILFLMIFGFMMISDMVHPTQSYVPAESRTTTIGTPEAESAKDNSLKAKRGF